MSRWNARDTHLARINRTWLAIIGLILIAAGAAALAKGLGLLGRSTEPVVSAPVAGFATGNAWFWPALAVLALVIGLLALRWLFTQVRRSGIRHLDLETDPGHGVTHLSARATAEAFVDDVEHALHDEHATRGPARERVRARLSGDPAAPRLALAVVLPDESDPAAARRGIQNAVARLRRSLETDKLPATVRMHTVRTHH
ncbi:hypothetical protein Sme01_53160 [Sphaerisporangium melleum]|uniref:Alkaline shock response membrane anchor protein AmaP n=1 Tax=Sphaerisporangium melleum TaxID=321316 RepID=A0A917R5H5_9ACTN|nr:alkaline shock response membrane anchor protein AmaP [Sphaerisporangium melleum]GGK90608.1 hypothetical protein GCM10007964_36580 [Sphaerisporangium melleum]GII72840.1 hypothetical protein Sme01_53160 [Sphaerisporangium melleum]